MTKARQLRAGNTLPGMSLVELLVAMVLLAIGVLAALNMQASAMTNGKVANNLAIGSFLAESKIEILQAMEFNEIAFVPEDPELLTMDGESCTAGSPGCDFVRTTTVVSSAPTSRSFEVSVEVSWAGAKNNAVVYDAVISADGF